MSSSLSRFLALVCSSANVRMRSRPAGCAAADVRPGAGVCATRSGVVAAAAAASASGAITSYSLHSAVYMRAGAAGMRCPAGFAGLMRSSRSASMASRRVSPCSKLMVVRCRPLGVCTIARASRNSVSPSCFAPKCVAMASAAAEKMSGSVSSSALARSSCQSGSVTSGSAGGVGATIGATTAGGGNATGTGAGTGTGGGGACGSGTRRPASAAA